MEQAIRTHRDIIDLWPTQRELAHEIGAPYENVRKWRQRSRIPPSAWIDIVQAAGARGLDLSVEELAEGVRAA